MQFQVVASLLVSLGSALSACLIMVASIPPTMALRSVDPRFPLRSRFPPASLSSLSTAAATTFRAAQPRSPPHRDARMPPLLLFQMPPTSMMMEDEDEPGRPKKGSMWRLVVQQDPEWPLTFNYMVRSLTKVMGPAGVDSRKAFGICVEMQGNKVATILKIEGKELAELYRRGLQMQGLMVSILPADDDDD